MSSEVLLEIRNLNKFYNNVQVLKDINLTIIKGEIFGILGLNGTGKTTLFKCILSLINYQSGEIFYKGSHITHEDIRKHVGFLPEFYMPPPELTGKEYLTFLRWTVPNPKYSVDSMLQKIGLLPQKLIKDYSRGMIQRLGVGISVLKDPELLILDEPTLGLDPHARRLLIEWLKELNKEGKTILLSSHDFNQVEQLCDRIGILYNQKLIYVGAIKEFIKKHNTTNLEDAFFKELNLQ